VISHVSRTLVSVSVCSARPNFAGCATAISFFASGPRTGGLHGPDAINLDLRRVRRRQDLRAEGPGHLRSSSSLASRSRAVRPMHPSQVGPSTAATLPPDVYIRPRK
jgi:hypothetical protein